jgi:dihydrofolate reductase
MSLPLTLVVAMGENRVIGRDNGLCWHLRSDLKFFKANTIGRPVIMGRKTFQAIGKPLPNRETIVLTRDVKWPAPQGVHVAASLDDALRLANEIAPRMGASDIAIAGGADLYAQTLPLAERILLTLVHASPDGDAFFPAFEHMPFTEIRRETHAAGEGDDHSFTILTYARSDAA